MTEEANLECLREEIAKITLEIFCLCGERLELAKKMAEVKAKEKMPIENLKVEEELRKKVLSLCQTRGIDEGFCIELLELLLIESKRVQRDMLKSRS